MKAFFDPATPVGICGCGEIIAPHEEACPDCMAGGVDPLDLDPVAIAVLVICTVGVGILIPLTWNLFKIWRNG